MSHSEHGRPLGDLLSGLVGDISGLFRKEIELAKTEASEKLDDMLKAAVSIAIGGVLAIGAVGVLLAAIVTGLAGILIAIGMPDTWAHFVAGLVVAAVIGIVAWTMIQRGVKEFKASKLNMQRTTNSLRMDAETVKESF
ncbi:MAG TPA: phage holin family protein [Devosia sp.]|jgi:phage-related tail protein|nr:phage holin family protein [Devosia sp.]